MSSIELLLLPPLRPPPSFGGVMDDPTPEEESVFLRPEPSGGLAYTFLGTSKTENGIPTYSMLRAGTTMYAVGDNVLVNCGNLEHPWIAKILLFYRDASGNMCVFGWHRGRGEGASEEGRGWPRRGTRRGGWVCLRGRVRPWLCR